MRRREILNQQFYIWNESQWIDKLWYQLGGDRVKVLIPLIKNHIGVDLKEEVYGQLKCNLRLHITKGI
jgi:hypothetical protein